jgi:ATP-dependent DNA helicase RecQ
MPHKMALNQHEILKKFWGFDSFRPMQEDIIKSVLMGNDTLALLPTGGGKSICFQVPALMLEGVCIVISPLIALMKDQEAHLKSIGISVASIHSGLTYYEVKCILQDAIEGDYQFLYLSPERLETKVFKELLPYLKISMLVVDEAHCISQWGYDFRPSYLRIVQIRESLPGIPLMALTASATVEVQKDILLKLEMQNALCFKQSFEKPNLSYSIFRVDSKLNKLIEILEAVPGSSIVYCNNRRQTKELAELLQLNKINADYYHAGLSAEERDKKQDLWIQNKVRVITCTNAFGLGIDKPDVRTVIHFDAPECLESYYQEAGRAGRDGEKAFAVLIYHSSDIEALEAMADKRYPPIPIIKKIYQDIANYLQLPVGAGELQYFDFDLYEFVKNFQLDSYLVSNTLKILEQEGHCMLSENIFLPSRIQFQIDKESLYAFELSYPDLEPIIKTLLRSYQGIYDNSTSIFEKQLSRILRIPLKEIQLQLKKLHQLGIIEYLPQKDKPQIFFLLNRAQAEYLYIDQDLYFKRKKQYQFRLDAMLDYIKTTDTCRSRFISNYFGEITSRKCGKCDNCLHAKKTSLSSEQFKNIELKIKSQIANDVSVNELLRLLQPIVLEDIWLVLRFLESEQQILITEDGTIKSTEN